MGALAFDFAISNSDIEEFILWGSRSTADEFKCKLNIDYRLIYEFECFRFLMIRLYIV